MADAQPTMHIPEPDNGADGPEPRRKTISSPYLHRLQRRHFLLFDVAPILGTAAALALLAVRPIGVTEVALLFSLWLVTGLGVTVGYHRLFTHRTFKAVPAVASTLAVLGSMAGQGPVVSWVALHRRHHERSDREGDPHSPNLAGGGARGRLRGLAHSHFLWMRRHEYPNVAHYAPDLIRNRPLLRVARLYYYWVALGLAVPALVGGIVYQSWTGALSCLLWGGLVRMFVLEHIIWSINSVLHMVGTRPYQSRDRSRNGAFFALLTLGESWHNNHHAFPESPSFGLSWYRLDPGYWLIRLLAACGLASDLGVPSKERIRSRRVSRKDDPVTAAAA
ncbi:MULTISPECIES: acyl-CoA desaturase [unclassified Pseudofrankia]|uniref:acyl-CoA desaturase n=1 Tax=unclassified Pseudofrankia TaxID=2994372 RepID=UPI0008DA9AB8|nr:MULTISPECIES: acyl-CoA desaturase [unclassified Pseudofrankia]MDT3439528.1 acyl-CoA desaturase [Pseudofrankia sp. BMG5.37]OHV48712.1 fatty acid desaturase [Pseudofrankia sp. BMG5.36]